MKRTFPEVFETSEFGRWTLTRRKLLTVLRHIAPGGIADPTIVLLTPGAFNSAYFEHTLPGAPDGHRDRRGPGPRRARFTGVHADNQGLEPVHVIYRRIDDDSSIPRCSAAIRLSGCPV